MTVIPILLLLLGTWLIGRGVSEFRAARRWEREAQVGKRPRLLSLKGGKK